MKLSDRLQLIADKINNGETMADIGTDHGFLPIYLIDSGKSPHVVMGDVSSGSLKKAEDNCRLYDPDMDFDLRLGNGIDVLESGEIDVVVMAGIGGLLICDILQWDIEKSRSFSRYILQPRNNPGKLRYWLYCNGFDIVDESLVRESRFIWEIFTVKPGERRREVREYGADFDYPDSLVTNSEPLTGEFLENALEIQQNIYAEISANSANSQVSGAECQRRIERLEELLERLGEKQ